jgi:hypothetical protein
MSLKVLGSNQTQITKSDGTRILFSYSTPVAAYVPGRGYIRTATSYSKTTAKHINAWLSGTKAATVPPSELDALMS